jgi:hypothetical protein
MCVYRYVRDAKPLAARVRVLSSLIFWLIKIGGSLA